MECENSFNSYDEDVDSQTTEQKSDTLSEYDKYCRMMAQQQEDEMDETILEGQLKEYQPEGVFVRGH